MKFKIPKPIVADSEFTSKSKEECDLDLVQKALEYEGYIVFRNQGEYLDSIHILTKAFKEE